MKIFLIISKKKRIIWNFIQYRIKIIVSLKIKKFIFEKKIIKTKKKIYLIIIYLIYFLSKKFVSINN